MTPTPGALGPDARDAALAAMTGQAGEHELDVLVVGGGITGTGVALDAVTRGLSVGLLEQRDLASGTSSRSSKLIHGGLRYLEMMDFGLVREALQERGLLLTRLAPHLVSPVPFLYPLTKPVLERAYVGAGLALYDGMAKAGKYDMGVPMHRHLTRRQVARMAPDFKAESITGAIKYYDCQVDDARMVVAVARTAAAFGLSGFRLVSPRCEVDEETRKWACYGQRVFPGIEASVSVDVLFDGLEIQGCPCPVGIVGEVPVLHVQVHRESPVTDVQVRRLAVVRRVRVHVDHVEGVVAEVTVVPLTVVDVVQVQRGFKSHRHGREDPESGEPVEVLAGLALQPSGGFGCDVQTQASGAGRVTSGGQVVGEGKLRQGLSVQVPDHEGARTGRGGPEPGRQIAPTAWGCDAEAEGREEVEPAANDHLMNLQLEG